MSHLRLYSLLMIIGLGLAYWASLPKDDQDSSKQAVFSAEPKQVTKVTLTSDEVNVVATRKGEGKYWLNWKKTTKIKKPAPKPQAGASPEPQAEPEEETKVEEEQFLASEKFADLLADFNPLQALRVVGSISDDQREEFGLSGADEHFTMTLADGKTYQLTLGKKSYGSRNRFVEEESKRVLLVDGRWFEDLNRAKYRLYERKLVAFADDEVSRATISDNKGGQKALAHTQRDKNGQLQWSDDTPDAPVKASYKSWMDKISRLRLMRYANPEEEAALKSLAPLFTVSFEKNGAPLDRLEFRKAADIGADSNSTEKSAHYYWVTSGHLGTHARLSSNRVGPIEKDLAVIVGK